MWKNGTFVIQIILEIRLFSLANLSLSEIYHFARVSIILQYFVGISLNLLEFLEEKIS